MTQNEFTRGSAVFLAVAIAGFLSVRAVDRQHDAIDGPSVAANDRSTATANTREAPPAPQTPCVGEDGTWKNWVWANVPMLSPKCGPQQK